jgi:hypothetical protein
MREVPLPSRVWVGTYEFPMEIVPPDDERIEANERGACAIEEDNYWIVIAAYLANTATLEVVLHEVEHAINWVFDINVDDAFEEEVVTEHGKAWARVWLDNPKLLKWVDYMTKLIRKERNAA